MDKLAVVFRDVFDLPNLEIDDLTRDNFALWDSLAHVKLIIEIEEAFNVKFTIDQVADTRSVEELRKLIGEKDGV
jgi:acyl carrier protein